MTEPPHPCAGCGFLVFRQPIGGGATCPLCGWIDDEDQARDPLASEGANALNLVEHQRTALIHLPPGVDRQGAWTRDPGWRPASEADARPRPHASPVCLLGDEPSPYYWR